MTFLNDYASALFAPFIPYISSISTHSALLLKLIIYLSTRTAPLSVHHNKFFLFLCNYHTLSPSLFGKNDMDIITGIEDINIINQSIIKNQKDERNDKNEASKKGKKDERNNKPTNKHEKETKTIPYKKIRNTNNHIDGGKFEFYQSNSVYEVYNDYNIIKEFMAPHTEFSPLITLKTFETINEISQYENELVSFNPFPKNSQVFTLLKNMNKLQERIRKSPINHSSSIEEVKSRTKSLIDLERNANIYFSSIGRLINSQQSFTHLMWNKNNYIWKKKFTQNTILLNIDTMLSRLNADTIDYIKSFIEPSFLESVRVYFIRLKYFPYPKQQITNYLHSFTLPQLHDIYRLYYTVLINTEELLKRLPNIHLLNTNSLVYDYFDIYLSTIEPNVSYETTFNKKTIIRLLTGERIVHFFDFQKSVYILYQIRKQKRLLNFKTPRNDRGELFERNGK
jgi:hypothetical protein